VEKKRISATQLNQLLLLHILDLCQSDRMDGATRFQKIVFMAQWTIRKLAKKLRGLNYTFIRWNYGPYSPDLTDDIELLRLKGYITKRQGMPTFFELTERGKKRVEEYPLDELVENSVADVISEYVSKYDTRNLQQILHEVYSSVDLRERYQMGETIMAFDDSEDKEKTDVIKSALEKYLPF
jgi:uncharacterized protein YwgA